MSDSLRLQYRETSPLSLLDRMEIDQEENNPHSNSRIPTLINRLEMSGGTPSLLNRMRMNDEGNDRLQKMIIKAEKTITTSPPWNRSQSTLWTTLSRASETRKLRSLKPYQRSSQSLISAQPDRRKPKTQRLNTIHALSTKSRPSLLHRLSEESKCNEGYDHLRSPTAHKHTSQMSSVMPILTSSYHRSVASPERPKDPLQENLLTLMTMSTVMTPTSTEYHQTKSGEFSNLTCPGSRKRKKKDALGTESVRNHIGFSPYSLETTKPSSSGSKTPERHPSDFLAQSGTTSCEDNLSTSMPCSHHCTMYPLLKRTLDAWDLLRSPLEDPNLQRRSKRAANGQAPGMPLSKRLNSLSPIENRNSESTASTLRDTFQPKSRPLTEKSSYMMQPSETKSAGGRMPCSLTHTVSPDSTLPLSCLTALNQTMLGSHLSDSLGDPMRKLSYATGLILSTDAGTQPTTVDSDMLANDASKQVTERSLAKLKRDLALELQPKYLRHNIWEGDDYFSKSSADWSETAKPLPPIPEAELANPIVTKTIKENPDLFDIVTPINVDRFEKLLQSHPNQPFVKSVCLGLCEGFWPWADTHSGEYPDTLDLSYPKTDNLDEANFLRDQRDHEIFKGCFSEAFGEKLLPGMYCMPVFAIPKPRSTDLRMVTHQSAGSHSLNSMIPRDDIVGYLLDNLRHLGEFLLSMHRKDPHSPRVLFKSDVAEAYRLLPVHPYWQIKQVNRIDGSLHVDRNSAFGGRASGCNWISFMSLVSWIVKESEMSSF